MCGLAGLILGKKQRRYTERDLLTWYFAQLLALSEQRGKHASGAAWLSTDGEFRLVKRPTPATELIADKAFHELTTAVTNKVTVLMGHTRFRTRGDERMNRNNHPIRAGNVIGTHNGTIYNADYLFRRFRLSRFAEVDSEIIFRLAARAARNGRLDLGWFRQGLSHCRGQMAAVLGSLDDPETVVVLKGNKPLEFRYHAKKRAVLYASDARYLDSVLADEAGWLPLRIPPMSLSVFRHTDLTRVWIGRLDFVAHERVQTGPLLWSVEEEIG